MHGYCRTEKIEESQTLFSHSAFIVGLPLSLFALSPHERLVRGPLSGLCGWLAAVNFRKLSCQEEIHGLKGLNKYQVKPSCAQLSKKESKKNLDISTEKYALEKMEWDNNCASIHLSFRRHLHKYLPF